MASSFVCFAMSSSSRKRGSSSTSSGPPDSKRLHVTTRMVEKWKPGTPHCHVADLQDGQS